MRDGGRIFWGIALLLLGGFFLAVNLGMIPGLGANTWAFVFAGASLLFFAGYFSSGLRNWGVLFPATLTGAIAAIIWLSETSIAGEWLGALFMFAMAVPFYVAFLSRRGQDWWALIPAWTLSVIAAVVLLSNQIDGELIGAIIMFAIALPFVVVYVRNREHWWALIPAGVMGMVGLIVLLSGSQGADELIGGVFMIGLGLVFFFVSRSRRDNWWALIPAGVLATVGLTTLAAAFSLPAGLEDRIFPAIFFGGVAVTFGVLWLLRAQYDTAWAKYPTAIAGLAAVVSVALGYEQAWPAALILAGLWILWRSRRGQSEETVV
jgi:hypothetical protein